MEGIQEFAERVIENVERVIIGKHAEVELALIALLCGGHVLVEDVPGVGKTSLAKAVARSIGCSFKRLQFTPDMLPSDITGVFIFNQRPTNSNFDRARLWLRLFLQMRSIAPPQRRSRRCSKPWRKETSRWMGKHSLSKTISRACYAKSY